MSSLDLIKSNMVSLRFGNRSGVLVVPRPAWKYQSLSWRRTRVSRLGFTMFDVKIVAGALVLTHDGRVLSRLVSTFSGKRIIYTGSVLGYIKNGSCLKIL